jgi:hypothetical protein
MPRKRESKEVINEAAGTKLVTVEVGQPDGKTKEASYTVPMNPAKFQEWIVAQTGEALDTAYAMYEYGVDRRTRQEAYEAAKSESTKFRVAGKDVELMDFPVANFVTAYNGQLGTIAMKAMLAGVSQEDAAKSHGFGPWQAAARKHASTEDGAKPSVRVKEDGTLELISA